MMVLLDMKWKILRSIDQWGFLLLILKVLEGFASWLRLSHGYVSSGLSIYFVWNFMCVVILSTLLVLLLLFFFKKLSLYCVYEYIFRPLCTRFMFMLSQFSPSDEAVCQTWKFKIKNLLSVRVSASTLASHPLVHAALSCLNSDQHLEAAVNGTHNPSTLVQQHKILQHFTCILFLSKKFFLTNVLKHIRHAIPLTDLLSVAPDSLGYDFCLIEMLSCLL